MGRGTSSGDRVRPGREFGIRTFSAAATYYGEMGRRTACFVAPALIPVIFVCAGACFLTSPVLHTARFRIKKKQWTLNLERTIGDLSGRVEELEREASELRRENGWLKEIVMLKSKRLAGIVPELEPSPSGSGSGSGGGGGSAGPSGSGSGGPRVEKTPEEEESDESDEAEEPEGQQRTRSGRNEKGKGRQQP